MILAIILISLGIVAIIAVTSQPKHISYPESNATEVPYGKKQRPVYNNLPDTPED